MHAANTTIELKVKAKRRRKPVSNDPNDPNSNECRLRVTKDCEGSDDIALDPDDSGFRDSGVVTGDEEEDGSGGGGGGGSGGDGGGGGGGGGSGGDGGSLPGGE